MNASKGLKQHLLGIDDGWKCEEMFESIQTEGPFSGQPALFIRLYGCNLNCSFCDTPQSKGYDSWYILSHQQVKNQLKDKSYRFVIITGGEPYLQNIEPLVDMIMKLGFYVQIETSGSLDVPGMPYEDPRLKVVVSPKTKELAPMVSRHAVAWKYVMKDNGAEDNGLPKGVAICPDPARIVISPMWESSMPQTKKNIKYCIAVCKHFGYVFTLQYHKMIGIQ